METAFITFAVVFGVTTFVLLSVYFTYGSDSYRHYKDGIKFFHPMEFFFTFSVVGLVAFILLASKVIQI